MRDQLIDKNLLIVGGSGFLSGRLAQTALVRGYHVWTITRGLRALPEGVESLIADRHEGDALKNALNRTQTTWDLVVDCIAFNPEDIQQDIDLFGESAGHLIFVSTDFVYDPKQRQFPQGEAADDYVSEGYGFQKRQCELALLNYSGRLPWTIVRPPHIYGPGSELGCLPAHSRDPELIERLQAVESLSLVGGGHFLQQPVFVRDLAELLLDLGGKENTFGQILNAPGPEVVESRRYYQIIADILGVDLKIEEIPVGAYLEENPAASSFLCHRFYDRSNLEDCGLPLPGTPLQEGLREQVESMLDQ